jgi:hypothetical protein
LFVGESVVRLCHVTFGRRTLLLNPEAIVSVEAMSPNAGVIVVLVTGEKLEDVEMTPRELFAILDTRVAWKLPVDVIER